MNDTILQEDMEQIFSSKLNWKKFADKTILITGGNGFLPAYIVDFLMYLNQEYLSEKCKVIALIRNLEHAQTRFRNYADNEMFILHHQDVSNEIIIQEKIDFIIHAASPASPKYYAIDPVGVSLPNILGTKNILDLAIKNNIESLLYFSSGEVYGELQDNIISENNYGYLDPLDLRSCYAESKRMAENLCVSYFHQYQIPIKIVRPFHTYGPGMKLDDGRVFADFVSNIVNNENIVLKSDGEAERVFCYLSDATIGFFTILLHGINGEAYNLANPKEKISIRKLAELLVTLFPDKKLTVKYDFKRDDNYIKSKVESITPDITKIGKLGWKPITSIKNGFKKTIRSYDETK